MAKKSLINTDNILAYPDEDFIPYACYIDKQTILTKNSDLLMTFKVPSFISNKSKIELFEIRESFRFVLQSYFKNQNISFYFTTVRKKANIVPFGDETNYFGEKVSETWNKQNQWNNQFVNEIYITIIISVNNAANILNPLFFLTSLTQTGINSLYSRKINNAHKTLKKFTNLILEKMSDYEIKVLSMREGSDGVIYSEHMRFLSLFVNLEKNKFPVTYDSISDVLRFKKMAYGYDMIEVDNVGNKKFASVMSVKSSQDVSLGQVDKILQLPMELIITETASFVDNQFVKSLYTEQKEMVSLSEDLDFAYFSGLDSLVSSNTNKDTDYCIGQTTIMLTNNNKEDLTDNLKELYKGLDDIGLVAVKENVYLPTIFWSQLPANFRYLKRFNITPTDKLGTFVSLFNFPTGKLKYNCWGNAITVIPTALNTPYFFNFHNQHNGNTIVVGLEDTGKTTIMNFLLSQTSKIKPKIFYIDVMRTSEVFINAMGGSYYKISPNLSKTEQFKINPFILENNSKNEKFLYDFIMNLVDFQDNGFIEMGKIKTQLKTQYEKIPAIIKKIFEINIEERNFEKVAELFNNESTSLIYNKLSFWYKNDKTSFVFNHASNTEIHNDIIGISLRTIINNQDLMIPVVQYLLHLIDDFTDGNPFILAVDDAWKIFDNEKIAPIFFKLLEELPKKNGMLLASTDGNSKISETHIIKSIVKNFATEIYLGNPKISSYQRKVFSLQEEESRILALMKKEDRNFLLKCVDDVVISSINLKNFDYYKKILSNDNIAINAMKKARENSNNPEVWVPIFLKILEEYDKAIKLKKLKENEINQIKWEEARLDENNKNKILRSE